ncbi:MAG: hypothetical protein ACRDJ9_27145, partial [Dehalococcoidia bacterium]
FGARRGKSKRRDERSREERPEAVDGQPETTEEQQEAAHDQLELRDERGDAEAYWELEQRTDRPENPEQHRS